LTSVFFHESVPPKPLSILLGPFLIFLADIFAAQGAPLMSLTPVANIKKSSIIKVLLILFEHLWKVELPFTCRSIFAFKFTFRSQQPDIVPTPVANLLPVSTTLVKLVAKFAASVIDTGSKCATGVIDTGGAP
jgi:hypothetical protein